MGCRVLAASPCPAKTPWGTGRTGRSQHGSPRTRDTCKRGAEPRSTTVLAQDLPSQSHLPLQPLPGPLPKQLAAPSTCPRPPAGPRLGELPPCAPSCGAEAVPASPPLSPQPPARGLGLGRAPSTQPQRQQGPNRCPRGPGEARDPRGEEGEAPALARDQQAPHRGNRAGLCACPALPGLAHPAPLPARTGSSGWKKQHFPLREAPTRRAHMAPLCAPSP